MFAACEATVTQVYAQATYEFGKRLSATLGGRYTREQKKLDGKSLLVDANLDLTNVVLDLARHETAGTSSHTAAISSTRPRGIL